MLNNYPRIRLALYIAGLGAAVVAPFVAITAPEYAAATVTASSVLWAAAGITAATNLTRNAILEPVEEVPPRHRLEL